MGIEATGAMCLYLRLQKTGDNNVMSKKTGLYRFKILLLLPLFTIEPSWSLFSQVTQPDNSKQTKDFRIKDPLPYRQSPVDYFASSTSDRMSKVVARLETEPSLLVAETNRQASGYLLPLLKLLEIPVESQLLVFSKTALNPHLVSPANPRAIYFNDDTYVGWVSGASSLEILSLDPQKGGILYTLRQPTVAQTTREEPAVDQPTRTSAPDQNQKLNDAFTVQRESRCLTCHVSSRTLRVPGVLLQSFMTNEKGNPKHGYSTVKPSTAYADRFGGWYVTGAQDLTHLGNRVERNGEIVSLIGDAGDGLTNDALPLATGLYPVSTSDAAALLVLEHQVRVHNLLIRVVYESAFQRPSDAMDRLCRELLFVDEPGLPSPIARTRFVERFESVSTSSIEDSTVDALRTLHLKSRVFDRRVSYTLTSRFFTQIDSGVRQEILTRLWDVIHDDKQTRLSHEDRVSVITQVRASVQDLPARWKLSAKATDENSGPVSDGVSDAPTE